MALNKTKLTNDLYALFDETGNDNSDYATARTAFVTKLATIIDDYVKSAKVNYTTGLTAGANPVVGTFNHTIS
jgi:hypothetical protein